MKDTIFKYYETGAHGYLKVPYSLIMQLNLSNQISKYSLIDNDNVFLEHHDDEPIFIEAFNQKYGCNPSFMHIEDFEGNLVKGKPFDSMPA